MALTVQTSVDIGNHNQNIYFYNPSLIDGIYYSSGQITFAAASTYNLTKSDLLLFGQFISTFNSLLILNFPSVNSSIGTIFPLCSFDFTQTNVGVKKIIYHQSSNGTPVIGINYVPIAGAAAIATRASPVTITLQEYFMFSFMMNQYVQQVSLN